MNVSIPGVSTQEWVKAKTTCIQMCLRLTLNCALQKVFVYFFSACFHKHFLVDYHSLFFFLVSKEKLKALISLNAVVDKSLEPSALAACNFLGKKIQFSRINTFQRIICLNSPHFSEGIMIFINSNAVVSMF